MRHTTPIKPEKEDQQERMIRDKYQKPFSEHLFAMWEKFNWKQEQTKLKLVNVYNLLIEVKNQLDSREAETQANLSQKQILQSILKSEKI